MQRQNEELQRAQLQLLQQQTASGEPQPATLQRGEAVVEHLTPRATLEISETELSAREREQAAISVSIVGTSGSTGRHVCV